MKRKRFTEEQIIAVLREHEAGMKTADSARKHGISEATLYNWKAKFGGMDGEASARHRFECDAERCQATAGSRGREQQAEEVAGGCHAGQFGAQGSAVKKMVRPAARREAVAHLRDEFQMSERRACSLVSADRKMVRYRSRRPPETELRERLRALANERRRFGYRRLFIMLRREGEPSGINRIYRLYREEGLGVRKRKGRKRAIGVRAPLLVEARMNARWSLDFVHDQMANGRRFRVLNITDDITHECLAAIPDTSLSGNRVARELTALVERRGRPGLIVSDNGTEFTSHAIFAWAKAQRIDWHNIMPGKPMQNGYVESFNGKMRDELLNETLFFSLDDARQAIAEWVVDYNTRRPHSALAYQTPAAFAAKLTATGLHAALADGSAFRPVAEPAQPGIQLPETLKAAG